MMCTQMKTRFLRMSLLLALVSAALIVSVPARATVPDRATRLGTSRAARIEVCFVLDTTGSMGGLIAGAKAKIWSIANQMVSAKPTPELRIGLIGYRDRGDEYVTRVFDLSDDIDAVYAKLQSFQAAGGGDTPESVNQALEEAVGKMSWSQDRTVLKIVFLVGDCPPHMDYQDDVKYARSCERAVRQDLVINTVQCGSSRGTTPIWQEIARLAEGRFVSIGQDGDMQVIETPMDEELAQLNREIGGTLVAYGSSSSRRMVMAKQILAEAAPMAASADRLAYNKATGKVVQGGGDLLEDIAEGKTLLGEIDESELPDEMKRMSEEGRKGYVEKKMAERQAIQLRIDRLLVQRKEYIARETRRLAAEGGGSSFDLEIARILREQAARKGIHLQ